MTNGAAVCLQAVAHMLWRGAMPMGCAIELRARTGNFTITGEAWQPTAERITAAIIVESNVRADLAAP